MNWTDLIQSPAVSTLLLALVGVLSATHPALGGLAGRLLRSLGGVKKPVAAPPPETPAALAQSPFPILAAIFPSLAAKFKLPAGMLHDEIPPAVIASLATELHHVAAQQFGSIQDDVKLLQQLSSQPAK
jgi:hypothetical protein